MLLKAILFCSVLFANEHNLVDLKKTDFSFLVEMPYSTDSRCLLREEAALALSRVQRSLQVTGNRLKILECYVPDLVIKQRLVQRKKKKIGFDFEQMFSRAGSVSVTVVDREGKELDFPGPSYQGKAQKQNDRQMLRNEKNNLTKLETVMKQEGFEREHGASWFFIYRQSKEWPFLNIPIAEIP